MRRLCTCSLPAHTPHPDPKAWDRLLANADQRPKKQQGWHRVKGQRQ